MSYQALAAHLARDLPLTHYRLTCETRGYRFIHTAITLQIELCDTIPDKEMHVQVRRLALQHEIVSKKLTQSILAFCTQSDYFPVAQHVTDHTRAFWEVIAGFEQNPECSTEYIHPAFNPFL